MTNDDRPYHRESMSRLLQMLRQVANFENAGFAGRVFIKGHDIFSQDIDGFDGKLTDLIIQETQLYRDSWLNPLIDELERRLK